MYCSGPFVGVSDFLTTIIKEANQATTERRKINFARQQLHEATYKDACKILHEYFSESKKLRSNFIAIEDFDDTKLIIEANIKRNNEIFYKLKYKDGEFRIEGKGSDELHKRINLFEAPQIPTVDRWDAKEFEAFLQYLIRTAIVYK